MQAVRRMTAHSGFSDILRTLQEHGRVAARLTRSRQGVLTVSECWLLLPDAFFFRVVYYRVLLLVHLRIRLAFMCRRRPRT